ncbi:hypothetical protein BDV34DRAFT_231388 [Aspergillus parasiticus]|uniref:Ketoreductase domain-containing protein n=1 Tax=Aspergillus parasiticus TaxID=5067 RepID=A0A5N6D1V5_ASPPA|nr:hypothetical protein BDV34DRAFT_231388 [Aspergillus parasiticus]
MEREGVLHIQRAIPDVPINEFKRAETQGLEVIPKSFHGNEVQTEVTEPAVKNHIKVKINFKDVSVTINIMPNNEYSLCYGCAGVIQRLGPAVKKFHVGDKARQASLDTESCVTTRVNNSALQSALILSATGGIDIACIERVRHKKAEDTSYESMIQEQYQNTIYAKVDGTWNLHNALKGCRVGQANYAAANTFLDAFASWRQRQRLCANSVDLGLIKDVGYVAEGETGLDAKINRAHWIPINESIWDHESEKENENES